MKRPFKTEPFEHQYVAYNEFKDALFFASNADMGIGKSKITIDILAYKFYMQGLNRVLIIAPSGVHAQWVSEQLPEHCRPKYIAHTYYSKTGLRYLREQDAFLFKAKGFAEPAPELMYLCMNIEAMATPKGMNLAKAFLQTNPNKCAIIVDEASIIKTPDIKTVKNVKELRSLFPRAFKNTLTGTPAAKGPVNLWSIYDFLSKDYFGCAYIAFKMMHTVVFRKHIRIRGQLKTIMDAITKDHFLKVKGAQQAYLTNHEEFDITFIENMKHKFGLSTSNFWHIAKAKKYQRYKNIDSLIETIRPDTYMQKKEECLDLPERIHETHKFSLNKHQRQLITLLEKYALATYKGEELTLEIKALLGLRVLQICGGFFAHHTDIEGKFATMPVEGKNAKLEFIKHDLEETGDQQSIIWGVYTPEIDLIVDALSKKFEVARLDGKVEGTERTKFVEGFKAGDYQVLVSNPEVGGFGYNFQMARIQYWYSRNYRTEARIQAMNRTDRIGIVESPIYKDLLYNIEWEFKVLDRINEETEVNDLFITSGEVQEKEYTAKDVDIDIKDVFNIRGRA